MKIGIQSAPYERFGKDKFCKLKTHGFDAIDYNMIDTQSELYVLDDINFKKHLLAEKERALDAGIIISQVHGPWRYPPCDSTKELRQERFEKMKKSILGTSFLGCKYWVIHPLMPYGTHDLGTENIQSTWNLNIEFFSKLVEFAKELDVTICLENMPMRNFSISVPRQILKFVKEINDTHLQICLDTGHVAVFPDLDVSDVIRTLNTYIKVLHIHDNMGDKDSHMWPTKGIINWFDSIKALKEIGYKGIFSLETIPADGLNDNDFEIKSVELYNVFKNIIDNVYSVI